MTFKSENNTLNSILIGSMDEVIGAKIRGEIEIVQISQLDVGKEKFTDPPKLIETKRNVFIKKLDKIPNEIIIKLGITCLIHTDEFLNKLDAKIESSKAIELVRMRLQLDEYNEKLPKLLEMMKQIQNKSWKLPQGTKYAEEVAIVCEQIEDWSDKHSDQFLQSWMSDYKILKSNIVKMRRQLNIVDYAIHEMERKTNYNYFLISVIVGVTVGLIPFLIDHLLKLIH